MFFALATDFFYSIIGTVNMTIQILKVWDALQLLSGALFGAHAVNSGGDKPGCRANFSFSKIVVSRSF